MVTDLKESEDLFFMYFFVLFRAFLPLFVSLSEIYQNYRPLPLLRILDPPSQPPYGGKITFAIQITVLPFMSFVSVFFIWLMKLCRVQLSDEVWGRLFRRADPSILYVSIETAMLSLWYPEILLKEHHLTFILDTTSFPLLVYGKSVDEMWKDKIMMGIYGIFKALRPHTLCLCLPRCILGHGVINKLKKKGGGVITRWM